MLPVRDAWAEWIALKKTFSSVVASRSKTVIFAKFDAVVSSEMASEISYSYGVLSRALL